MQVIDKVEISRRAARAAAAGDSVESNPYQPGSAAYDHWRTEYLSASPQAATTS